MRWRWNESLRVAAGLQLGAVSGGADVCFCSGCRLNGYFYWLGRAAFGMRKQYAGGGDAGASSSTVRACLVLGTLKVPRLVN